MKYPIKQDIGDAYYHYQERSKLIRTRYNYFQILFKRSLEKRYLSKFNNHYLNGRDFGLIKLLINGREYIIGDKNSGKFGVIIFPEETTIEEVVN